MIKKCLIVENSFKERSSVLGLEISSFLEGRGVSCDIFAYNGRLDSPACVTSDFEGYDFVVTLGGDGTVLFVCRQCAELGIPVFPVNLGEFGFLANIQPTGWVKELDMFLEGKSVIAERSLLQCEVVREGKTFFTSIAMNDVTVASTASSMLINLNVAFNHALLGPFKANGIIIASPTGSTAYSAAAGGPIIDPGLEAMVLTPISSFSLSARPLVFGSEGELTVTVLPSRDELGLSADGQISCKLQTGDVVITGISKYKARLIGAAQEKFYSALQSKLNWSGGPRA